MRFPHVHFEFAFDSKGDVTLWAGVFHFGDAMDISAVLVKIPTSGKGSTTVAFIRSFTCRENTKSTCGFELNVTDVGYRSCYIIITANLTNGHLTLDNKRD